MFSDEGEDGGASFLFSCDVIIRMVRKPDCRRNLWRFGRFLLSLQMVSIHHPIDNKLNQKKYHGKGL